MHVVRVHYGLSNNVVHVEAPLDRGQRLRVKLAPERTVSVYPLTMSELGICPVLFSVPRMDYRAVQGR